MSDTENNIPSHIWAAAVNLLSRDELTESLQPFSDSEIKAVENLPPDRWPSIGQTGINWDLSVQGRVFTFPSPCLRVLQPASHTDFRADSLVLGKAAFSDFDPLLHPFFRLTSDSLWNTLDSRKLARAILHIANGAPISPGHLCVHKEGGFHWGDGTHRYEVLKRTGSPVLYFLASPEDVARIETLLSVEWFEGCCPGFV
ncbi:TPA: hypothetical protein PPN70_004678 [Serratia rubidaea]|nr:hypothetical protein [Serratia rubidaea]HDJ1451151.1 hypothetical protein [Serratia rubidaea]HDJ1463776.1 hypothetical protein [Serratia rubidaea]HDJ2774836.1 hypothetical protein [Serratia rubidaea]